MENKTSEVLNELFREGPVRLGTMTGEEVRAITTKFKRMEKALEKLTTTEAEGWYYSCETVDKIVREALAFDPLA